MECHSFLKPISSGSFSVAAGSASRSSNKGIEAPAISAHTCPPVLGLVVGNPGSNAITYCHSSLAEGLATSSHLQDHDDPALIDIEEIGNGYTLLRFGFTDGHGIASDFLPTMTSNCQRSCEVIDCQAIDSLSFKSHSLPSKNIRESSMQTSNTSMPRCNGTKITIQAEHDMMSTLQSLNTSVTSTFFQQGISKLHVPLGNQGEGIITAADDNIQFPVPDCVGIYLDDLEVCGGRFGLNLNTTMAKLLPVDSSLVHVNPPKISTVGSDPSTIKRLEMSRKSSRLRERRLGKAAARDLYKSNSFQLYEVIFSYPFTNTSKGASLFQTIPKEKFKELCSLFNHIAIGLAGGGLALVLFVASRMLSLNAILDSVKVMCLARGFGLLWLSVALQRFGSVVKCMADVSNQARPQRKEHFARFRKETQAVAVKAFTLLMLSMLRLS